VKVQHYSLKSSSGGCHFTDWIIEGSNDNGATWSEIDNRHTDTLIGNFVVETFASSSIGSSSAFNWIRWRMTDKGKGAPGSNRCCYEAKLCNIEFFGFLV
jgi:hypothetical protein